MQKVWACNCVCLKENMLPGALPVQDYEGYYNDDLLKSTCLFSLSPLLSEFSLREMIPAMNSSKVERRLLYKKKKKYHTYWLSDVWNWWFNVNFNNAMKVSTFFGRETNSSWKQIMSFLWGNKTSSPLHQINTPGSSSFTVNPANQCHKSDMLMKYFNVT